MSSKSTGLLTVSDHLGAIGGAEIAQLRVIEGLATRGWAVELLYVSRGDIWTRWNALASSTRNIRASNLQKSDLLKSGLGSLETVIGMVRSDAPIIYVHNPADLQTAVIASRIRRVPVVVHLHLPPPFRQPGWLNRLIGLADAIITPSTDAAERWVQAADLAEDKVSVIPTGVDTELFRPISEPDRDDQRRTLGIDPDVAMLLYAGRLDPTKGLHHLLEAFDQMKSHATLVICGDSADADYVSTLRQESEGKRVVWLDRRLDMGPLMGSADLVVLPSVAAETQGMVVIEGMSCGTPAIASAVGGLCETLSAFPDHLVAPGDSPALASTIDRMIGWRAHSPSLGSDSRRWVREHRTLDDTVIAVSRLLTGLLR